MANVSIPRDGSGAPVQVPPAVTALAQLYDETISSSTEITLNADTTFIEVTAINEGAYMKWGTDDVTNANFDEYIAKDSTRQYYVPTGQTAVNFLERAATALLVVIEK